jgi:arsenate reductase-like glutaredoxin family protein
MKKIYHLGSCDTCRRILKEIAPGADTVLQDIGQHPVSAEELDEMYHLAGSYEALLNKRARLYAQRGLKDQALGEADFRRLLLDHYTFLKRPVVLAGGQIYIGNSAKTVSAAKEALRP